MKGQKSLFKAVLKKKTCLYWGAFLLAVSLIALTAPLIAPYPFYEQFPDKILQSPSREHWLGTDHLGRDLLSRLLYGSRMSMAVGVFTALASVLPGLAYGMFSAYAGGVTDRILMRIIDIMYSIPSLVLLILVKVVFDSVFVIDHPELRALTGTLTALSLLSWTSLARVIRGQTLQAKENLYVEAVRSGGAGDLRIVLRHILPNIMTPVIVLLTFQIPANIIFESMLSFLGLGLEPPFSSWGVLVEEGWRSIDTHPRLLTAPGLMLFLTMLAFNFFGDGLRDVFDPNMSSTGS